MERMQKPTMELKKIHEHDMDLLIMEEFVSDRAFAKIFLDKLHLSDEYSVCKVVNSLSDADGESDITLILQYQGRKVALLLENKIDAQTMPKQSERYHIRGETGRARGDYSEYFVLLVAPADYHKEHLNDANAAYEYRVCYEELAAYFASKDSLRAQFKEEMINSAIREKKAGYIVQEHESVTEFWSKLRQFCKENYPGLAMVGADAPKGAAASWPEFRTSLGTIKVVYKSQKGFVDLEFPRYGDRTGDLITLFKDYLTKDMQVCKTGKSASIRLSNDEWAIDFTRDFESCRGVIDEVLGAVSKLCALAATQNLSNL